MLNDLSVARQAFRQSTTLADALLTTAKVQLDIDNATVEGERTGTQPQAAQQAEMDKLATRRVDKTA